MFFVIEILFGVSILSDSSYAFIVFKVESDNADAGAEIIDYTVNILRNTATIFFNL